MEKKPLSILDIQTAVDISENPEFDKNHNELNPKYVKIETINNTIDWLISEILNAEPQFRDEDAVIALIRQAFQAIHYERYFDEIE